MIVLAISTLVFLVVLYFYLTRNFNYWQKREIPIADGVLPGFGHMKDILLLKSTISETLRKIYKENKNRSMVGIYSMSTPSLLILEPELVKTVLQTKFVNFHENYLKTDPKLDPLLSNNPFFTYGEKWQTGRKRLTYAFSNVRLKILFETVKQVCLKLEEYMDNKIGKAGRAEFLFNRLFAQFTAQVVSTVGFGIDGLCFDDNEKESLFEMGNVFVKPSTFNHLLFNLVFLIPTIGKLCQSKFLPQNIDHFFRTMVRDVLHQRRKQGIRGNDFLQLMVDLEKMEGEEFEMDVIASHAVSFFIDGYTTSSYTLSFVVFHLANNPEVQKKLREEVVSVINKYNGELTFEGIKDMTYLEKVIMESMRVTPSLGFLYKVCTEDTELAGSDGLVCHVKAGTPIMISVRGLHEDARYWENPEEFDPDRFSADRKHSINRFTYIPFGEGPRMCVGMRMALLQIKMCLITIMRKYSVELSPKTRLPLKLTASSFLDSPEGGLWGFFRPL
ncbi:cytochrome P450 6j1 [Solenopsis invicta]|uniref:cytochrome P450 6j1 n=1 Tax=Solenopsis invicta TaxID=13686 RepID=UPI0001FEB826|nr:cytochrome P450 6j1 [Solenopsis invicta]